MLRINKYIEVINSDKIINAGRYNVGSDIPSGEYYLWGKNIWYSYTRKMEKESHEYKGEAYDIFQDDDKLCLEAGRMTLIDNLHYLFDKTDMIFPEHIYRVGLEIPEGYYLFKYDKTYFKETVFYCHSDEECAFDMHENYSSSSYHSETKRYGCVCLEAATRHIEVRNGVALYYGGDKFDEEQLVRECEIERNRFFCNGIRVFDNAIIDIVLYEKYRDGRFCGEVPIDVLNYEIYTVGNNLKWKADIIPLSFQNPRSMAVRFIDITNRENSYVAKIDCFSYRSDRERHIHWFNVSVLLPQSLIGKQVTMELVEYNGKNVSGLLRNDIETHTSYGNQKIRTIYKKEYDILKGLLENFDGINMEYEVTYLEKAPDLIAEINECLQGIQEKRTVFENENGDADREITFSVPATYDKKFYCCAKLADVAYQVSTDEDNTLYTVVFRGNQIAQIEIMSYLLYDVTNKEAVINREYLKSKSFNFFTLDTIQQKINSLNEKHGYSSLVTNSVLVRIIRNINKNLQQRVDAIYSDISREGRVQTRWGNEYHLFVLVSKYVSAVQYQYHCEWLEKQSYDVYLSEYKIAIEYQGQQHYEAVSLFGGDEGLKYNQERDKRKKQLSKEHGIKLLEWKYTVPVNEKNVIDFLVQNGVRVEMLETPVYLEGKLERHTIMAPVVEIEERRTKKNKVTVQKIPTEYIVNYTLDGKLKCRYNTIGDAAKDVGISSTSISKALRGERNTAGGFIWKRCSLKDGILEQIDINFDLELTNSGLARRIAKIDTDGNILLEYKSIVEAAKSNNMRYKTIQEQVKKSHGWKYL